MLHIPGLEEQLAAHAMVTFPASHTCADKLTLRHSLWPVVKHASSEYVSPVCLQLAPEQYPIAITVLSEL